jgi:toxin-antitoxin system PIN domain toxin
MRQWWEESIEGRLPVGMPWVVAAGFVRLITHPRVLVQPLAVSEATRRVRRWLDHPNVTVVQPGSRFARLFLDALDAVGTAGNLTTDAHLAALAIEHQAELHTNDADFTRFTGLRWRNPLRHGTHS